MSESRPTPNETQTTTIRVPEPSEIAAWAVGVYRQVRDHLATPHYRALWGIALLSLVARVIYLDLLPFEAPQVQQLLAGRRLLADATARQIGIRSPDGVINPPLLNFCLALPALLGRDPRIAVGFLVAINVAGIAGLYLVVRRSINRRAAVLAALLWAVNPWAVFYSRQIGSAALLAPLGVALLYALYAALIDDLPWGWTAAWVLVGLMVNADLAAAVLVFVLLALTGIYHRRVHWPHVLLGLCVAALILVPYAQYENAHRLENVRLLLGTYWARFRSPVQGGQSVVAASWLHAGSHLDVLAGGTAEAFAPGGKLGAWMTWLASALFWLSIPAALGMVVRAWSRWKQRENEARYVVPIVWLWIPLVLLPVGADWREMSALAMLFPVGFLAMGVLGDRMMELPTHRALRRYWWAPILQVLPVALFVGMLLTQAQRIIYINTFITRHDTTGGHGTPYRYWRRTADLVRREVADLETDQVWIMARGDDVDSDPDPMILDYLLTPNIRTVYLGGDGQPNEESLLLPAARPGAYLIARPSPRAERMLRQLQASDRGLVLFPGQAREAKVQVIEAQTVDDMLGLIDRRGLWALDSGLRLLGYNWPPNVRPGETGELATFWTYLDVPPDMRDTPHTVFNQLIDAEGTQIARTDGYGLRGTYWEPGLLLVQWVPLPIPASTPPGEYGLLTGMYRLRDGLRSRRIDEMGYDIGDVIPLGPLDLVP